VVGGSTDDDAMVIIPDLMYTMKGKNRDDVEEDLTTTIAAAPNIRAADLVQAMGELEMEFGGSQSMINPMQSAEIPGLDLSRLIADALYPPSEIEDPDVKWEWGVVFNQVATKIFAKPQQ
jgi:hypothetical protein